jgi:hypothetical protein
MTPESARCGTDCRGRNWVASMRNWAIGGIAITLLTGSASSMALGATYISVKEVCLFSPTMPPANSTLAIQSIGEGAFHGPDYGYDFVRDLKTGFAGQASTGPGGIIGSSAVATAAISLKGIYEPLWHSTVNGKDGDISEGDGANFEFRGDTENVAYSSGGPKFTISGVSGVGVERNGFVAGFNFKY